MRHKPRGKFIPREPMVFVHPYAGYRSGQMVPRATYNRLRRWWRMGMICQISILTKEECKDLGIVDMVFKKSSGKEQTAPAKDPQLASDVEGGEASEPTPVTAEEGEKGWYRVLFSDGSEKSMRRSAVEDLGLL